MMAKMSAEEKHLYTRYFYNSIIEFIYFLILYLETYGTGSLSNINKYVKFFNPEVSHMISSFRGETVVDKLIHMLKIQNYFIICENKISLNKIIDWKNVIFEDFVISKCVDLLLRKQTKMDDICKNLNLNSVITLSKRDLVHIIEKYSYISVSNDQIVTLHHYHGLIGFEGYTCKRVVGYFYDILHHGNNLSFEEIENHSKSLSLCGLINMIQILSILCCSHQFTLQDGYVFLNKKAKKYLKQRTIDLEKMQCTILPQSLNAEQIVYNVYGRSLHHWTGEISTIKKNYGVIYCVVDFTNGHQAVFKIYFSKGALKVISELNDLKYLKVRDIVEFDADYYSCNILDRCWKATRIKLRNDKFEYDEAVIDKINKNSELARNECSNNECCTKINLKVNKLLTSSLNSEEEKINDKHKVKKKLMTSDYDSCSSSDSNSLEIDLHSNLNALHNQELSTNFYSDVTNEQILDYLFVFGYISMLMEDKCIATANYDNKFYHILFMKSSVYRPDESGHIFLKGQKVLAVVPCIKNVEPVCVSSFVYCLNEAENNEIENVNISPKEFAVKTIFNNLSSLYINSSNYCSSFSSLHQEFPSPDLKYDLQLSKLYYFIKTQYRLPFANDRILLLLHIIMKTDLDYENFDRKVFHCFLKFAKCLSKHTDQIKNRKRYSRKKNIPVTDSEFNIQKTLLEQNFCTKTGERKFSSENDVLRLRTKSFRERVKSENVISNVCLSVKSTSLSDSRSLSSFKTCSTNSSEVFYSCQSESPNKHSDYFFDEDDALVDTRENGGSPLVPEIKVSVPLPTIFNDECTILSMNCNQLPGLKKYYRQISKLKSDKYLSLSLQSMPSFKRSLKNYKRVILPDFLKTTYKNCARNYLILEAKVSLISLTFFFFATNIDGHDVLLPFPKNKVSPSLLENIKLNSSAEIVVILNDVLSLSHVLTFHLFI